MTILAGTSATGANAANSNAAGVGFQQRLQVTQAGVVTGVWLRNGASVATAANSHYRMYADVPGSPPTPGAALTPEFSGTAPVANSWTFFPISNGPTVTVGQWVWVAFLQVAGAGWDYTDFQSHPGSGNSQDTNGGQATLPDPANKNTVSGSFTNTVNTYVEGNALSLPKMDYTKFPKPNLRTLDTSAGK